MKIRKVIFLREAHRMLRYKHVVMICLCLVLAGCGRSESDKKIILETAMLCSNGDYAKAEPILLEYIQRNPKSGEAYYFLGICQYNLNQFESALHSLSQALELDQDNNAGVHYQYGLLSMDLGHPEKARVSWQRASELAPTLPAPFFQLGQLSLEEGDYDSARDMFERVVSLDLDNARAHFNLGSTYFHLKDYERMQIAYEAAIKLDQSLKQVLQETIKEARENNPVPLEGSEDIETLERIMIEP